MVQDLTELRGEGWKREQRQRAAAILTAAASMLAGEAWFGSWWSALADDGTITRLLRRGDDRLLEHAVGILEHLHSRAPGNPIPLPVLAEQVTGDTKALLAGGPLATLVLRALAIRSGLESVPRDRAGSGGHRAEPAEPHLWPRLGHSHRHR